jgi:hypothetical protein
MNAAVVVGNKLKNISKPQPETIHTKIGTTYKPCSLVMSLILNLQLLRIISPYTRIEFVFGRWRCGSEGLDASWNSLGPTGSLLFTVGL